MRGRIAARHALTAPSTLPSPRTVFAPAAADAGRCPNRRLILISHHRQHVRDLDRFRAKWFDGCPPLFEPCQIPSPYTSLLCESNKTIPCRDCWEPVHTHKWQIATPSKLCRPCSFYNQSLITTRIWTQIKLGNLILHAQERSNTFMLSLPTGEIPKTYPR